MTTTMDILLWTVQILLAVSFVSAGVAKLLFDKDRLRPMMPWVDDFSPQAVRGIGVVEILGGIGVVLPTATGILPVLAPLAAIGLAILMVGGFVVHVRRREYGRTVSNVVLLALAVVVIVGRF